MGLYSTVNNILFYGMALHIYMTNYYPMQYNNFLIESAHFCVLNYSRLQIFADRLYRNLKKNPEFDKYASYFENALKNFFKEPEPGNIEIIKYSQVMITTIAENLNKSYPDLMDFLIFSDRQASGQVNRVIYFEVPTNFSYVKCKYKFVSLTVVFSEREKYNLKLFSENDNYFIANNRLNKFVFCFLIRKQFGIIKDECSVKYKLEIIDQDINLISFTENDEIFLDIDGYSVLPANDDSGSSNISYSETHAEPKEELPPFVDGCEDEDEDEREILQYE